jgi:hypothetical protein
MMLGSLKRRRRRKRRRNYYYYYYYHYYYQGKESFPPAAWCGAHDRAAVHIAPAPSHRNRQQSTRL